MQCKKFTSIDFVAAACSLRRISFFVTLSPSLSLSLSGLIEFVAASDSASEDDADCDEDEDVEEPNDKVGATQRFDSLSEKISTFLGYVYE